MLPDELKARARRLAEELLTQGDLAVADELLAPTGSHHAPNTVATGVDGVKSWVGDAAPVLPGPTGHRRGRGR